ncbi:unnamed protein product, partial [Symbiodinium necroappetens]
MPAQAKADANAPAKFRQMDSERVHNGVTQKGVQVLQPLRFFVPEDAMKVVDVLRPAVEARLADIKASSDRPVVTVYDATMGQQDLIDPANFAIMKRYVPMLLTGTTLPNPKILSCKDHRAAMLYVGSAYGFWSQAFVSARGNKGKMKDWSALQGTRLRWLVSYLCKVIYRTPFARTPEVTILKTIFYKVNNMSLPTRKPSSSSVDSEVPSEIVSDVEFDEEDEEIIDDDLEICSVQSEPHGDDGGDLPVTVDVSDDEGEAEAPRHAELSMEVPSADDGMLVDETLDLDANRAADHHSEAMNDVQAMIMEIDTPLQ